MHLLPDCQCSACSEICTRVVRLCPQRTSSCAQQRAPIYTARFGLVLGAGWATQAGWQHQTRPRTSRGAPKRPRSRSIAAWRENTLITGAAPCRLLTPALVLDGVANLSRISTCNTRRRPLQARPRTNATRRGCVWHRNSTRVCAGSHHARRPCITPGQGAIPARHPAAIKSAFQADGPASRSQAITGVGCSLCMRRIAEVRRKLRAVNPEHMLDRRCLAARLFQRS